MKIYVLNAIINNKLAKKEKVFATRSSADSYLEKLLDQYNLEVNDVIYKDNKHSQEFVCNTYNRFIINREIL